MLRVGLTGGLASGKSHVGRALAELGCHVIQADQLGHQVLLPGGEAYEGALKEFGGAILGEDGAIDRRKLAAIVFADPERLAALNRLVHPPVIVREEARIAELAARDPNGIAVVEAAILIETGSYKRFDRLILAVCDERVQIERAMKRDGLTEDEVRQRLRHQMPLEEKKRVAHFIIDTSGTKQATFEQTRRVYDSLRALVESNQS